MRLAVVALTVLAGDADQSQHRQSVVERHGPVRVGLRHDLIRCLVRLWVRNQ